MREFEYKRFDNEIVEIDDIYDDNFYEDQPDSSHFHPLPSLANFIIYPIPHRKIRKNRRKFKSESDWSLIGSISDLGFTSDSEYEII